MAHMAVSVKWGLLFVGVLKTRAMLSGLVLQTHMISHVGKE